MIDLGVQAQEAATRSQTLAAANQAVDASRGDTPHPAVARTLTEASPRAAGTVPAGTVSGPAEKKADTTASKSENADDKVAKSDGKSQRRDARPETSPAERAERMALMQSPARSIASAMRMPKHTGNVQCDHSGDISVWHLIGHMAKGANQVSKYGFSGIKAGSFPENGKEKPGPGLMDGLRTGYSAGRAGTPSAAVAAAALAADAEAGKTERKPTVRRSRDGGMER